MEVRTHRVHIAADLLADHDGYPLSICRHPFEQEPTVTAASVIFDCARRHATVTLGPACTGSRFTVDLAAIGSGSSPDRTG